MKSEFGKGFIYNLFLFAKHWWRAQENIEAWKKMRITSPNLFSEEDAISLWFNGAGDHFFDLEVPNQWEKKPIGKLARKLQDKALRWRMEELGNKKDFDEFFEELEKLTRMIDEELGIKDIKAEWN